MLFRSISGRGIQVLVKLDSAGESAAFCGQEAPPLGWFSRRFDVKEPSPVLVNTLTPKASIEMQTIITIANHF